MTSTSCSPSKPTLSDWMFGNMEFDASDFDWADGKSQHMFPSDVRTLTSVRNTGDSWEFLGNDGRTYTVDNHASGIAFISRWLRQRKVD